MSTQNIKSGRLLAEEAGKILGFKKHDMPILVRAGLVKPLGGPAKTAVKYYANSDIEKVAQDPAWLSRATKAVYRYWAQQNQKRRKANGASKTSGSGAMLPGAAAA